MQAAIQKNSQVQHLLRSKNLIPFEMQSDLTFEIKFEINFFSLGLEGFSYSSILPKVLFQQQSSWINMPLGK